MNSTRKRKFKNKISRAIGWEVLQWLRREHQEVLPRQIEGDAVRVLEKIKTVLNDDTLSDPDCFIMLLTTSPISVI